MHIFNCMLYLHVQYGVPLDNRADYTKADWEMWIGAIGSEKQVRYNFCDRSGHLLPGFQFSAMLDALFKFLDESPDRIPFTDW